ncbi:MAG: bifunctional demethylmenaquinone methyltransferase/2-methoxy-6-polyprenyl-1,4-benzoquinol methylase UbiE [Terriglobia bacterium]
MNKAVPRTLRGSPLGSPETVAETARSVRGMFDAVAPRYDFLNHFLSLGFDLAWRRAAAQELRGALHRPESVALDLCCGTGDLAFALAKVSKGRVLGADFSQPMLQRAVAKNSRGHRAVFFLEGDCLSLPFADGCADAVTTAFGFRNLASYALGLREMRRVLKPEGVVAILEFSTVEWPLFGPVFRAYFAGVLPWIGNSISGVRGAYQYLHDSVKHFPNQEELAALMREERFEGVRYRNFMGGVAALHLGVKPGSQSP